MMIYHMCLASSEFALIIWQKASSILDVPFDSNRTWRDLMILWFHRAGCSSQVGNIVGLLPCIISWMLWHRTCKGRMEDKQLTKSSSESQEIV